MHKKSTENFSDLLLKRFFREEIDPKWTKIIHFWDILGQLIMQLIPEELLERRIRKKFSRLLVHGQLP